MHRLGNTEMKFTFYLPIWSKDSFTCIAYYPISRYRKFSEFNLTQGPHDYTVIVCYGMLCIVMSGYVLRGKGGMCPMELEKQ